jgi:hypothetical protein
MLANDRKKPGKAGLFVRWAPLVALRPLLVLLALAMSACTYATKRSVVGACPKAADSGILNFCEVTPGVLWRGGTLDPHGAAWLMQHGVRTIVNLELARDDHQIFATATITDEGVYEADYFRVRDWQPLARWAPSILDDHIAHFLAIVSGRPQPVYVHCLFGMDRTGVMIAAYRMLAEGVATETAIEEMRAYQAPWFEANAKYLRALGPERRERIGRQRQQWLAKLKPDARISCGHGRCLVTGR